MAIFTAIATAILGSSIFAGTFLAGSALAINALAPGCGAGFADDVADDASAAYYCSHSLTAEAAHIFTDGSFLRADDNTIVGFGSKALPARRYQARCQRGWPWLGSHTSAAPQHVDRAGVRCLGRARRRVCRPAAAVCRAGQADAGQPGRRQVHGRPGRLVARGRSAAVHIGALALYSLPRAMASNSGHPVPAAGAGACWPRCDSRPESLDRRTLGSLRPAPVVRAQRATLVSRPWARRQRYGVWRFRPDVHLPAATTSRCAC